MSSAVLDTFLRESEEDLTRLNNALLDLEDDPSNAEAIDAVFRVSHTLKGNFGAVGYPEASDLAHAMEDLLDEMREGEVAVTPDLMDCLFEGVDTIEMMLSEIADDGETSTDPTPVVGDLRRVLDEGVAAAASDSASFDDEPPLEALAETDALGADGAVYRVRVDVGESATSRVDAMFVLDVVDSTFDLHLTDPPRDDVEGGDFDRQFDCFVTSEAAPDVVAARLEESRYVESAAAEDLTAALDAEVNGDADADDDGGPTPNRTGDAVESIRVDVDQIDTLYNQVEEMVTSRIKLRKIIDDSGLVDAEEELNEHDKITSRLQDTVLEMRLVPLQNVAGTLPRLVRDLARTQDKDIDFEMDGTDIEMDRSILNEMRDPLVHLVRNAVDHGIESPDERVAAGKTATGTVTLRGRRDRDRVTITVEDDGRGLDVDSLREKAVEKGVMTEEEVTILDDSEVYDLIFHPGFSTRDEVTDVSGRGVGMDVVQNVVRRVDGSINVESEAGAGTTITLSLPVSVAIVRVLFVETGGESYGIPIKNIDEIQELQSVDVQQVETQEVVTHDDRIYPIVSLDDALDVPEVEKSADDMLVRIDDEVRQVAIRCGAVTGQEEVVIKPFEGVLSGTPGISGASVLGEGEVVMILDVETL